jgi:hypothetical protein
VDLMNANFLRRTADAAAGTYPDIETRPSVMEQACCCPSQPAVRVLMPPTADRPHETDLLLCGHHCRASRDALAAAGATVQPLR